jgi:hypothetical protein
MKNISTLLTFISVIFLLSSCTSSSYMLTEKDLANDGVEIMEKPAGSNFRMVSNKPAAVAANADAKWVAAANPHVGNASARLSNADAIALSAATTVEGHEIMRREIEKAMKTSKSAPKATEIQANSKKQKKNPKSGSNILL